MKHKKYERIEGAWKKKTVEYLIQQGFSHPSIEWCVTEKIHGSNFAFYMTYDDFKVAKRNDFLKDGENFFQYLRMKESNGYKVREMWDQLVKEGNDIEELIIYGELFGGNYPHKDVERVPNVRKIQKGVYYHPDVNFYCFDIMLNGKFLPMDEVCRLCEDVDIFYAKILFRGTFDECIDHSNKFQTKIPGWFDLPPIDNNICEGIVLKPIKSQKYDDGSRVILKSKNDKFMEISSSPRKKRKKTHELSEYAVDTLEKISPYINENRLRNVLSKIGTFTMKDFKKVFDAFKKDIYENFNMDHDNLRNMEKVDKKEIDKVIEKLCVEVWRPKFLTESERE